MTARSLVFRDVADKRAYIQRRRAHPGTPSMTTYWEYLEGVFFQETVGKLFAYWTGKPQTGPAYKRYPCPIEPRTYKILSQIAQTQSLRVEELIRCALRLFIEQYVLDELPSFTRYILENYVDEPNPTLPKGE